MRLSSVLHLIQEGYAGEAIADSDEPRDAVEAILHGFGAAWVMSPLVAEVIVRLT